MKASTKKLLSLLIVMAMVLAMAPAITLTASAAASMKVVNQWITDTDSKFNTAETQATPGNVSALCPVCGSIQTWQPYTSNDYQEGIEGHYYLAKDIVAEHDTNVFDSKSSSTSAVCLYLNDHTINTMGRRIRANANYALGNVLNVIGDSDGKIICNAADVTGSKDSTYGVITIDNLRTISIYGGTYINEQAGTVPMFVTGGTGKVNIYGGTFTANGGTFSSAAVKLYGGTYDFNPSAADNTTVDAAYEVTQSGGKYTVALPASANPAPELPAEKKAAVDKWRTENASEFTAAAEVEDEVVAFCPCCWQENVTWKPLAPTDAGPASGHYYLIATGENESTSNNYCSTSGTLCLYLNNKELTINGRFQVRSKVNLIGNGSLIRTSGGGASVAPLEVANNVSNELNIYGGTYTSAKNQPLLNVFGKAKLNIYGGEFEVTSTYPIIEKDNTVEGSVNIYQATFTKQNADRNDTFGSLGLIGNAVVSADRKTTTWYPTYIEARTAAVNSNGTKAIKMFSDGDLDLGGNSVYVDCNGKTVTVTNGTLYGFESTGGSSTYGVRGGGWIIGNDVTIVRDVRFGGNRYVTLNNVGEQTGANAGKLTATSYRYNLDVTAIALRTGNAGLYYKTTLRAAPALANRIKAYGVVLSLDSMPGANWEGSAKTAATCIEEAVAMDGNTATFNSGILANIMKAGEDNATRGEMEIYANAYLKFDFDCDEDYLDEQYIMAVADSEEDVVCNMQNVMETINDRWENYAPAEGAEINAQDTVADFYTKWNMSGFNWALDNIADYVASKNA